MQEFTNISVDEDRQSQANLSLFFKPLTERIWVVIIFFWLPTMNQDTFVAILSPLIFIKPLFCIHVQVFVVWLVGHGNTLDI